MAKSRMDSRRHRWMRAVRKRMANTSDLGQAGIVAVVAFSVLASVVGAVIVQTIVQSDPLLQTKAVEIYAHRALEAGQNAYLTAVNANPSLATCSTNTNNAGTCSGIDYGQWNFVNGSNASGADNEYYAFGNPQPTFDPTTNALTNLSVQVVGAAYDPSATNHYLFDQETVTVTPSNGFLQNVWWSNYESYSDTGNYSNCQYNWNPTSPNYNILGASLSCSPVYFGPSDYLFGPVYTNDSVFVSPSPSFGTSASPSTVSTADPNCLFVDSSHGMNGNPPNCAAVGSNDVATYDTVKSASGHAVEQPPVNDTQLGTIAGQNGCLYSGPTQITLSTDANGKGQMTVVSPDTVEGTQIVSGTTYPWDTNNITTNVNNCPNNGTAPLPPNGVVFVQNNTSPNINNIASPTQAWANPFDDPTYNSVTNLTSTPASPTAGNPVTLTATVTSGSSQLNNGATVAFSQTTRSNGRTTTSVIGSCSSVSLANPVAVTPATTPPTYTTTATCATTEANNGTGAFSATYSGGTNTSSSSANLGQPNTLSSTTSYGPDAQVTAGGCSSCYYGQTGSPDAEGDAFVNGSLSGQLTIGTANNVIIDGNITYADCASTWTTGQSGSSAPSQGLCPYSVGGTNDTLGLIANNYVEVNRPVVASSGNIEPSCGATPAPTCDPSDGTNGITIDAAVLALTQSFVVNNYAQGGSEGPLTLYGSVQQYARGPVGTFSGSSLASGYQKHYTWDPLLNFVSPPSYLVPSTPSWVLASVTTNAGVAPTNVCPPLLGVYNGLSNGVPQTGPAVTQYCSTAPGALPNYPSTTAPSQPTGVTAVANPNGTVTVTWTDPPSNNGSAITGYSVAPSPSCSGCSYTPLTGPSVTSTIVTGLTPGSTYTFSVTATNGSGTSSPSTASNSVTVPNVPSAPTNVSAVTNANGSVTVTWTDPSNNGSPITGYSVAPNPACAGCSYTSLTGPTVTSTTITGLTPGGTYTLSVSATNLIGTGSPSAPSNSITAPNVPGAPTIGTATAGNASAVVSWTAPASNGGSAITGYVVTPYIGGVAQTAQTFSSTATTQTVTGLTNGTAYTFKVAASNSIGTGAQSSASNSVTTPNVPSAPTGVVAVANSDGTVTVNWTDPANNGSAITGYTVTPSPSCAGCSYSSLTGPTVTSTIVTSPVAGSAYTFTVSATNGIGTGAQSAASNSVTVATVPGAPTIGTVTRGNASAVINWTAPASNGGSAITGYAVTPYIGAVAQTTQTFASTATTQTATGLINGTAYTFRVAAINGVGTSAQSAASASVTPATTPGAPTIGTVTRGNASAVINWTAPASNGGSAITGYVITPYIGAVAQTAQTFVSTATTQTATGLTNGTAYTFKVAAINAVGTGAQSAASASVTPATTPGAPTIGTATRGAAGSHNASIAFTAPASNGGSPITSYTVTATDSTNAGRGGQTASGAGSPITVGSLTVGDNYTFKVTAANAVGTGSASAASNSITAQ